MMATLRRLRFFVLLASMLSFFSLQSVYGAQDELTSNIRRLLDLYSHKDVDGVMKLFTDEKVLVMGSDLSEVCTSRDQAAELFRNDFKLWDSSSFGTLGQIHSEESGRIITAFFDVPFTFHRGGTAQTLVIRFATVWKKTARGLKLLQSMNTTPTVGQSAKELSSSTP